jgi:hypothetical protein
MKITRRAIKMKIKKLALGKYKNSCCPRTQIATELKSELNLLGIKPEDHLIAVMNMFPDEN